MWLRALFVIGIGVACLGGDIGDVPGARASFSTTPLTPEIVDLSTQRFTIRGNELLVFCETRRLPDAPEPEEYRYMPTIFRYRDGEWDVVRSLDLRDHSWIHVARQPETGRIWAISTYSSGDAGSMYEIVYSSDAGKTWEHIASVKKIYYMADLRYFRMNRKGEGALVEFVDDVALPLVQQGYYTYSTKDWGHTWSQPEYTEDVLVPALQPAIPPSQTLSATLEELVRVSNVGK